MSMVTRFLRVVIYFKKLLLINSDDPLVSWPLTRRDKLTTYLHLQKAPGHQYKQSADIPREDSTLKTTKPFDHFTNVKSRDNLKNVYLHLHKTYGD